MTKIFIFMLVLLLATMFCGSVFAGSGPAPNSGDGVPDGSGMDDQSQNGDPDEESPSPGPAPNSGDGVPDGSGF